MVTVLGKKILDFVYSVDFLDTFDSFQCMDYGVEVIGVADIQNDSSVEYAVIGFKRNFTDIDIIIVCNELCH